MAIEAFAFATRPPAELTGDLPVSDATARHQRGDRRLGIVGAGKLGTTIARAAIAAGYDVAISGSGPADDIALTVDVLASGARAVTTDEVVRHADIVILAVPTHRFRELPPDLFADKILVDAMNYWQPVDGDDAELAAAGDGTSTVVQQRFRSARVVKSFNQLGYHELDEYARPRGAHDRIAIGAAGEDRLLRDGRQRRRRGLPALDRMDTSTPLGRSPTCASRIDTMSSRATSVSSPPRFGRDVSVATRIFARVPRSG